MKRRKLRANFKKRHVNFIIKESTAKYIAEMANKAEVPMSAVVDIMVEKYMKEGKFLLT